MKIKKIELFVFFLIAFLMAYCAFTSYQQGKLAEGVVRLRVVASGNDMISQSQKLHVRDAILESCSAFLKDATCADDVWKRLYANPKMIENAVRSVVGNQEFCVNISKSRYPTREYQKFALPSGRYIGVQVFLGEARGKNWWCVLYPDLCVDSDFSTDVRYNKTTFSFKCMEWVSVICERLWE